MIDVVQQINAVRRQVGARVLEAGEARTITISRIYDADLDDVWDTCTNPERIPRWFLPVSGDLRLHGRYQLEGNAGGTIESCDPPNGFGATWEYGGEVSWIELRLGAEPDGRTRFELDHISHVDNERWAEFGPGATGVGWDLVLTALELHIRSAAPVDPGTFAEWTASADGRQFITLSSEHWYAANIEAGTGAAVAREAADRTTAAYTAVESPES